MDGRLPIRVLNDILDSGFASEDFDTVGGLVLDRLGRIPEVDDEVRLDDYVLHVDEVDGSRVARGQRFCENSHESQRISTCSEAKIPFERRNHQRVKEEG